MRFIFGPIMIALGVLLMKYTVQITNFTGALDFAEKYLKGGVGAGTYTWWRLVGLFLIAVALAWMFGVLSLSSGIPIAPQQ
jgi:hypothetical protein